MLLLATMSILGMVLVASTPNVPLRLAGIAVASLSSGVGELSFLGLTHHYLGKIGLAGFSSGTGAAGLVGAGAYALATTVFDFSSRATIYSSSILPLAIVICYFVVLPSPESGSKTYESLSQNPPEDDDANAYPRDTTSEQDSVPSGENGPRDTPGHTRGSQPEATTKFRTNLSRARKLLVP